MKYYIDTEFHEYKKQPKFLGFNVGKPINTIELISIGIVAEDGREFYAISKEFDIKAAWNSFQLKQVSGDMRNIYPYGVKEYWLRDNVLKPIFEDLWYKNSYLENLHQVSNDFTYVNCKKMFQLYGMTNLQIANSIVEFVYGESDNRDGLTPLREAQMFEYNDKSKNPEFYAYYADYDWVVFCWIFGRMIDLPKGFPMYCRDLKQISDELFLGRKDELVFELKKHADYKPPIREHNALADAHWNKHLHKVLINSQTEVSA